MPSRAGALASRYSVRGSGECIRRRTFLEIQDDVGDVLDDADHRGELVLNTLDPDGGDGAPCNAERRILRIAFPRVVPKPRSSGSATNFP